MNIGDRIKSRRNELGLTLKDVADKLGVRHATVQRYESGNIKNLKQETISKLAEILKVEPEWLMGWKADNPQSKLSDVFHSSADESLLSNFHKLNRKGKEAAQAAVKGMTCLPEYTEEAEDVG